jgi:polar amino acid transport system substrate-binding protein
VHRLPAAIALAAVLGIAAAGCGSSSDSTTGTTGATASACTPAKLATHAKGKLTVATDKPAFPPYIIGDDPTNGKGFESAVAYAVADKLGYPKSRVVWTVEPFNASYAPGPKDFDFDVNQISITPARSKQVDFSVPYYTANQAVVALKSSDAAKAKTVADLGHATIGVQIGTTSLDAVDKVIKPSSDPKVFDNSNDVVTALKQGQVDAVVVDVPTALYVTTVQVPQSTVVWQFPAPGGDQWGALLSKDSPLTACVSKAVEDLKASGQLKQITDRWISKAVSAPQLSQ